MSDSQFLMLLELEYFNMSVTFPVGDTYREILYMVSKSISKSIGNTIIDVASTLSIIKNGSVLNIEQLDDISDDETIIVRTTENNNYGTLNIFNNIREVDNMTSEALDEQISMGFSITRDNRNVISNMLEISTPSNHNALMAFITDSIISGQTGLGGVSFISSLREQLANLTLIDEIRINHLTQAAFDSIKIVKYGGPGSENISNENCTICYCEFENDEELKLLNCSHAFHTDCLEPWLTSNNTTCPICREHVTTADEDLDTSTREVENTITLD